MTIAINPGSGPVAGATLTNAWINIGAFAADLIPTVAIVGVTHQPEHEEGDGRYRFDLAIADGRVVEVEMPGLTLDKVRFLDQDGQDPWLFPRLYVDGSSWLWEFALSVCQPDDDDRSPAA